MKARAVIPRQKAEQDIDDAIDFYANEDGAEVALGFLDELEAAFLHLAVHPDSGSLRYSAELDIPNLRYWAMRRYPHLIFYVSNTDKVDVWRVLHGKRDIPESMHES